VALCTALRRLGLASLGAAVLTPAAAWGLDRFAGRDVILILPHAVRTVEINRATREAGESAASLYGTPVGGDPSSTPEGAAATRPRTTRIVFARADRLVRPPEDPTLLLFKVDKQAGENPLQAMTLHYVGKWVAVAAGVAGLLLVMAGGAMRSR
jgi:hypothetical protein